MNGLLKVDDMLRTHARLSPNAIGARDLSRTMSFADWNARSHRLANALLGAGLEKGDRLAVLAYNRLEWADIYVAAAISGLVVVPINFRLTAVEIGYIIADADVSAIIVEDALAEMIDENLDRIGAAGSRLFVIGSSRAGFREYETFLSEASSAPPPSAVSVNDPWCMMYTSGTTGNPKGAVRNHRGMSIMALMTCVEFRLNRRDTALLVMPMCHANSLNFFTACLCAGAQASIFSRSSFDPELCLRTLRDGITFSSLVPTHYAMMLDAPRTQTVAGVEKLLVSSSTAFPETKRAIIEMFPNSGLFELYGSTEAGWVTTLLPEEQFDHLGTVGREAIGSRPIRLLDDDGNEVPDGEPGELFSSSPYQFVGYWNLPDKTAEAFRGDYLSVGDIAVRDCDGFIRLIDRKKNLIVSGGENIYPAEIEQVLIGHPDIREVAVIGRPDRKWSETVVACIVPKPGVSPQPTAVVEWAKSRLAGYKRPREVIVLAPDEMPRNATGKIMHRKLRDMFQSRLE
ncbi:MAG: AMP-binding protein [Pseudomonadota bacterium]